MNDELTDLDLPLPDFDEFYVVDRTPDAIVRAKAKWCELEQMKLKCNRLQCLAKNNKHSLATSNNTRRLIKKCEEQGQRELWEIWEIWGKAFEGCLMIEWSCIGLRGCALPPEYAR